MGPSQMLIRDLYDKIGDITPDRQALTLRHLTDLFLVGAEQFSSDEIALIDDIFVRLVESIDDAARALLASRLGPVAKAPPKVLHRLACDDMIDVAAAVLTQSEALDDATLIECAVTKTQDHMLAISQRKTLSESVTDVLVKRGDRDVVLSTAMNAGARFSKNSFAILVKRAQGDDALTGCVGRRPDLPPALFDKLLEAASDAVRAALEAERPHLAREIDRAVSDVTAHIRSEATTLTQQQATARVRVHSLNRAGKLNRAKLEEFAKAGRAEELAAALALMAHVSDDVVVAHHQRPGPRSTARPGEDDPAAVGNNADHPRHRGTPPARPKKAGSRNTGRRSNNYNSRPRGRSSMPAAPTCRARRRTSRELRLDPRKMKPPGPGTPKAASSSGNFVDQRLNGLCYWPLLTMWRWRPAQFVGQIAEVQFDLAGRLRHARFDHVVDEAGKPALFARRGRLSSRRGRSFRHR